MKIFKACCRRWNGYSQLDRIRLFYAGNWPYPVNEEMSLTVNDKRPTKVQRMVMKYRLQPQVLKAGVRGANDITSVCYAPPDAQQSESFGTGRGNRKISEDDTRRATTCQIESDAYEVPLFWGADERGA